MQREHVSAMTCGEAVMRLLAAYEVDTVFGMAGTMTLELYRGIARTGIRHVQCRNEQGASFMADGYARATGKPGVCTIIGGPGVTNAATAIAQAYCDSQPVLVLSGASPAPTQGKGWGAIHELNDQAAVTAGFTAFSAMVRYPEELPELIARAYAVFRGSRPRPVHLSLPRDVLPTPVEAEWRIRRAPTLPMPQADGAAVPRREPGPGDPRAQCREVDPGRKAARARLENPAFGPSRGRHRDGRRHADRVHGQLCHADGNRALLVLLRLVLRAGFRLADGHWRQDRRAASGGDRRRGRRRGHVYDQ